VHGRVDEGGGRGEKGKGGRTDFEVDRVEFLLDGREVFVGDWDLRIVLRHFAGRQCWLVMGSLESKRALTRKRLLSSFCTCNRRRFPNFGPIEIQISKVAQGLEASTIGFPKPKSSKSGGKLRTIVGGPGSTSSRRTLPHCLVNTHTNGRCRCACSTAASGMQGFRPAHVPTSKIPPCEHICIHIQGGK